MIDTLPPTVKESLTVEKLKVRFFPLFNVDGFLIKRTIGINKKLSLYGKRFTICHELGHYLNGDKQTFIGVPHWKCYNEKRADKYAMDVLLPTERLLSKYEQFEGDLSLLEIVFGVEMNIIYKRLIELGVTDKNNLTYS